MDIETLKEKLFNYIALQPNPNILYDWEKTSNDLNIEIIQLEYIIHELGKDYFVENKSGFFVTKKAIVEAKYNIKPKKSDLKINYTNISGDNYGLAGIQDSFERGEVNLSNQQPNQNISTKSQKSFWQKILQFIVDNIVKIVVGVIIGLLAIYFGFKKD